MMGKTLFNTKLLQQTLFIISAVLGSQLAFADKSHADDFLTLSLDELGEITIATRTSRSSAEIPSTVFVYGHDEIRRHGWNSLSELMQDVPGVDVVNKGGGGITLSVRGVGDLNFHGSKTVIMVDGHNTAFSSLGAPGFGGFMQQYDILNAKRVEIQIGPGGTLHGANAFGIVINIISMAPEDVAGVAMDLIYGSQGKLIPAFRFGIKKGAWGFFQSLTAWNQWDAEAAEIAISRNPDDSLLQYDNSTFEAQTANNLDMHGYLDYDNKLRMGYRYSKVNRGRGTSLLSTQNGNVLVEQPMFYVDYNSTLSDRLSYKLTSHYKTSRTNGSESYFVDTVRNNVGVVLTESDSLVVDNQFTFSQNKQLTWVSGLFIEESKQRPVAVRVVPGTVSENDRQQPALNNKEDFDSIAGYLQLEWIPDNKFYLVSGLRYIKTELQYPSELIPRLGMSYVFSDNWLAKFNYQRGYRPPAVGEGRQVGLLAGNPNLSSETIDSYELSMVGKPHSRVGIRASYFYSNIRNLIGRRAFTGGGGFTSITDNIGEIDVKGMELATTFEISQKLEIKSTATYTDSTNKTSSENTRTIIPYKLNLSFVARPSQNWSVVWDNYFRWQPTTDSENALFKGDDADDWILSNLTINHDRAFNTKGLSLSLSIRNIFNEKYGHVDPRPTTNPGTPFLTSYHPQETLNALFGIHYRFQ